MAKKIFIVGAHPGGNKGGEAMLSIIVSKLSSWPEIGDGYEIWLETIDASQHYETFTAQHHLARNFFRFEPQRVGAPYQIESSAEDVMLDISGLTYADTSLKSALRQYRRHNFFASRRVRMIFFTQDYGPTERWMIKALARRAMGTAQTIFLRSKQSLKELKQAMPSARGIGPYPDCTMALKPSKPLHPIEANEYFVIVPSAIMWNLHGDIYLKLLCAIAMEAPQKHTIVVMTHNFTKNGQTTDLNICQKLVERIGDSRRTFLHSRNTSPSELKYVLASAQAVVTSRYHALVGALSCNTPAAAIGWSHKYAELLSSYGLLENSIRMEDVPESDFEIGALATEFVDKLISNTDRHSLEAANAVLSKDVEASFSELRRVLSSKNLSET